LDNTFKTPKEVQRYLRLPNLGVIPDFVSGNGRRYIPRKLPYTPLQLPSPLSSGKESRLVPAYHPFGVVTEAYRTLRAAILLSRSAEPPKTILFTSSLDGEGKTVTVVNTAIVFAQMGVPVLVIDADLRRPNCHRVLGMENGPGLTEVLTGQSGPMEVIRPTATHHLALLSAGSLHPHLAELVGSTKMRETIASLQQHYDYILIDSPPVMQVSDAMLVSTMVHGVVLVVNSQETPKNVVKEACARLGYAQAEILGVMLNRVNLRSGDYAYYYRSRTS
jgi:capsular exopolysaccharide synthesis family protein